MSDSEDDNKIGQQLGVVFVGDVNVGKTSIIRRFCYDEFTRQYAQTIGADFYIRRLYLPGNKQEITIRITDIGGMELNGHMLKNYFFKTNMIILVYDITNCVSFDCLLIWIETINRLMENPPISAIIGNKCDLEHQRAVRLDKTQNFIKNYKFRNYLVSAKTGEAKLQHQEGINRSLIELISKYLKIPLTKVDKEHQETIVKVELINPNEQDKQQIKTTIPSQSYKQQQQQHSTLCCLQ